MIKSLENIPTIIAGDETILKEVLHPKHDKLDLPYSLAHAVVRPGEASLPHILKEIEVYYILEGTGEMHLNKEVTVVRKDDIVVIPGGAEQWIKNIGEVDLVFLAMVSPPWSGENEEIVKG